MSVRKVLAEEKKSEKQQLSEGPERPEQRNEANAEEPKQGMISEIERDGQNDNEDINFEYFVSGQKKYFVPHHNHHNLSDKFSKDILIAENMLLRIQLKNEMGKRIEELELR